ncbi:MAG: FG-GAP-like repeat-containing protein [Planctomycetota bacterium]
MARLRRILVEPVETSRAEAGGSLRLLVSMVCVLALAACDRGGGGGSGSSDGPNPFAEEMPVVALDPEVTPTEVLLPFLLWGEEAAIRVETLVSGDGGRTFARASGLAGELGNPADYESSEAGVVGLFKWDAVRDFGASQHEHVVARFVLHSGRLSGAYAQTDAFALDLTAMGEPWHAYALDGGLSPIAGVRVRLDSGEAAAETGTDGSLELAALPAGSHRLTFETGSGRAVVPFTFLTTAGENGRPFVLAYEDTEHRGEIPPDREVTLGHPDWPGLGVTVGAGSATFPDGSHGGLVSLTWLTPSDLPAPLPAGEFPLAAFAIAPSGLVFDPGAGLTVPSPTGLRSGSTVTLWRLPADTTEWEVLGNGTVVPEGTHIVADPGTLLPGAGIVAASFGGFLTDLEGRVVDAASEGVSGAWVLHGGQVTTTSGDGSFRLMAIAAGYDEVVDQELVATFTSLLDVKAARTSAAAVPPVTTRQRAIEPELGSWTESGRPPTETHAGEFYLDAMAPEVTIERLSPQRPDGRLASRKVEVWAGVRDLDSTEDLRGRLLLTGESFQVVKAVTVPVDGPFVAFVDIPDEAFSDAVMRRGADLELSVRLEATDASGRTGFAARKISFPIGIVIEHDLPADAPSGAEIPIDITVTDRDWGVRELTVVEYHGSPSNPRREFVQKLRFVGESPSGALPPVLRSVLTGGTPSLVVPDHDSVTLDVSAENGLGLTRRSTLKINGDGSPDTVSRRITGRLEGAPTTVGVRMAAVYSGGVTAEGALDLRVEVPVGTPRLAVTFAPEPAAAYLPFTVEVDLSSGDVDLGVLAVEGARTVRGQVVGLGVGPLEGVFVWMEGGSSRPIQTDAEGRFELAALSEAGLLRIRPPRDASFVGTTLFVEEGRAGSVLDVGRIVLALAIDPPLVVSLDPHPFGAGETVSVRGRGFPADPGGVGVHFGGLETSPLSAQRTALTVVAPDAVASGQLWVAVGGVRSNSLPYEIRPYIDRITPNPQAAPLEIIVHGSGFAGKASNNKITFSSLEGVVKTASPTRLTAAVPYDAVTGLVRVRAKGRSSNPRYFMVRPAISSVEPSNPSPLEIMTVRGTGFHAAEGATTLQLAGEFLDPSLASTRHLQARLPLAAHSGSLVVTSHGVASASHELLLSTTTAIGRVEDHLGRPIPDALITLHGDSVPGEETFFELFVTTQTDGSFEIPAAPTIERLTADVRDESRGYPRETSAGPLDPVPFGTTDFGRIVFAARDWPLLPCPTVQAGREPVAVAVGDLNHDALADIVAANIWSDEVSVRLARDNFQPDTVPSYPVGQDPWDITLGDLNGDGHLDIVVTNRSSDNLAVLRGLGDGTFLGASFVEVGREPLGLELADLDADGHLDAVVASEVDDGVTVLLGRGDGTFGSRQFTPAGNAPQRLVVADLDLNRKLDVVTANFTSDNVTVLLGRGDGTFASPRHFAVGLGPMAVACGDVDRDGRPDLVTANSISSTISVLLGLGDGTFSAAAHYLAGATPVDLLVLDFTLDGLLDVATANATSNDITVLEGLGDGGFRSPVAYLVGNEPAAIACGVVDDDSRADLVTANRFADNVAILLAEPTGVFRTSYSVPVASTPGGLAACDLDGDGAADLVVPDTARNVVAVSRGKGDGTYDAPLSYSAGLRPGRVSLPDLDNDGRPDIIAVSTDMSRCTVLLQEPSGSFTTLPYFSVASMPVDHAHGLIDADPFEDLVLVSASSHVIEAYRGVGDGTFGLMATLPSGREPRSVELVDMDRDTHLDIVTANAGEGTISVLRGDGEFGFALRSDTYVGVGPDWLAMADFNGDGYPDTAVSHPGKDRLTVMLNQGDGSLGDPLVYAAGHTPVQVWAADINIDGIVDLVAGNLVTRDLTVLLGVGDGSFEGAQFYASGNQPSALWVGDLNRDGGDDVVTSDPASGVLIHLNQTLR